MTCVCGKYKKCPATESIEISGDGQVKIKSKDWFKCYNFKKQMENIDKLIVDDNS